MNKKGLFIIILSTVLAASCGRVRTAGIDVLPIVERMIADTSCAGHSVVEGYEYNRMGSVAVFGPSDRTLHLTDFLLECDIFDNVDGKNRPDWLPDFAGETFASYLDVSNGNYCDFFTSGREKDLRTFVVRGAVATASGKVFGTVFSDEAVEEKVPSKILILSSSFASLAEPDVDTLFSSLGKSYPVITPVNALVEAAAVSSQEGCVCGLWADSDVIASGVYADAFHRVSSGTGSYEYAGFSPEASGNALDNVKSFIDMYVLSGYSSPLSILMLDPFSLSGNYGEYEKAVQFIRSDDSCAEYRKYLSDSFVVVDSMTAIATACYSLMRSKDMFTHRIAYPEKKEYTVLSGEDEDSPFKYVELTAGYVR